MIRFVHLAGGFLSLTLAVHAAEPGRSFRDCKTWFQTNSPYDPRIAIATDAVVVHRHGEPLEPLKQAIGSWKAKGFVVGRMFFSDSDATLDYWKGKWDGKPHDDEVEKDSAGKPVLCAGFRPYMLPTEGWMRYLEETARMSIEAGADAILPEEPLAHSFTGYEAAFKPLFEKRFGIPWKPESASPEAHFLTCQLKAELYLELEQRLARLTKEEAKKRGRDIPFVLPVHSLYSNRAAHLVAPMGMSSCVPEFDGFVGQVWTGPVNWALANYSSPDKSFFTSAYALYDYFAALTANRDKKLWLLADPVEDDPKHTWAEFEEWYRHCLAAKLMFPAIDTYEVMPWPDRIFLPGQETGGGTPAPEKYRIGLLSAIQVLQDVPQADAKANPHALRPVGVAIGDSALWLPGQPPVLDGLYSLMLPLVGTQRVAACLAERWTEPKYLDRFSAVVLSYENFVPTRPEQNVALADWVKRGGSLVVLGGGGNLKGDAFWWTRMNQPSPLHHLLSLFATEIAGDVDRRVGRGWVMRREVSPRQCASSPERARAYWSLVSDADLRAQPVASMAVSGRRVDRGPYTIAHAQREPKIIDGPVVDVLDPDLPLLAKVTLHPGQSGIYRQVGEQLKSSQPAVLHCTHRLVEQKAQADRTSVLMRGPAQTPAAVRMWAGDAQVTQAVVHVADKADVKPEIIPAPNKTVLFRFDNVPEGAELEVSWKR
jgi:hypothetical protein